MTVPLVVRKARPADVPAIASLVNGYAGERKMLPRTPQQVALALDDYMVATDEAGRLLACGALREYSPSAAEVSSIAVAREAKGRGLGRDIVRAVEALARKRGFDDVFLFTVCPEFFAALGYTVVNRGRYPEKICPHRLSIAHCEGCEKLCMWRMLRDDALHQAA